MKKQLIVGLVIAALGYTGLQEKLFAMDPMDNNDFLKIVLQDKTSKIFGLWYLKNTEMIQRNFTQDQKRIWDNIVSTINNQIDKTSERVKHIKDKIVQKKKEQASLYREEEERKNFFMQKRYRYLQKSIEKTQSKILFLQNKLKKATEQVIPATSTKYLDRVKRTLFSISMNDILPLEKKLADLKHEEKVAELKFRRSVGNKSMFSDFIQLTVEKEQWLNAERNLTKEIEEEYKRALYKLHRIYQQKLPRPRSESK